MLFFRLHALGWDGPHLRIQINLRPSTADDFTGAAGAKDSELQGPRGDALARCELRHKLGHFSKGQRRVMLDFGDCIARGEGVNQVAVPASRVFSRAIAARFPKIENGFNPAADPACRFGLGVPDRLDRLEDERLVDCCDWQLS